ncbi:hypothetical protein NE237_032126 [Protea cynaroides]|uniref:Uncharacterized protein n=1 Tax=Protea cynaroides TaxID=273540 RepID=A0A9Q0L2R0_9MAGN|nr:hypothetical protein NE237_032126 [Protea cynaroides]
MASIGPVLIGTGTGTGDRAAGLGSTGAIVHVAIVAACLGSTGAIAPAIELRYDELWQHLLGNAAMEFTIIWRLSFQTQLFTSVCDHRLRFSVDSSSFAFAELLTCYDG